jgi:hypothetical protein
VTIELAEPGTALELEPTEGQRRVARTATPPFVDPKKAIPAA